MKPLALPRARPCKEGMHAGEFRRVPRRFDIAAVGYYFACPDCGIHNVVQTRNVDADGHVVKENDDNIVSLLPAIHCDGCACAFLIENGRFKIKRRDEIEWVCE